jgi:hypothetical protein
MPAVVLKLDFSKAFDSINLQSLRAVMLVRGFPVVWCDWMQMILESSRSAILMNGIPGPWIDCKRGLRQGDPLSPYLFLLVADVLQQLIRQDPVLCHPLVDGAPCPMLQYADDTLIIMRAGEPAAARLKLLLDQFAEATGLTINFHKSTLVQMHVDAAELVQIQAALGCRVEGFPQTYLGPPLSAEKLKLQDFAPLIAKIDRYLSGWCAILLSAGGRIVLLNAILDALPIFAMGAVELPPALLRIIEGLRRAFLWNTMGAPSGAKCLVKWAAACRSKNEGGLGIKNLAVKNFCLQMKLLHRLHTSPDAPWPKWFWANSERRSAPIGHHADRLFASMPLYRGLTTCQVGDGRRTAFWLDTWVGGAPLAARFVSLFSHALDRDASVHTVLRHGVRASLVPRLNATGESQLPCLLAIVDGFPLTDDADVRSLTRCAKPSGALDPAALFKLLTFGGVDDPFHEFIWKNFAPPRVQFFAWLLSWSRIPSRSALLKKRILTAAEACCPLCDHPEETANHIMFECPFSRCFWAAAGCAFPAGAEVRNLHEYMTATAVPPGTASTFILLCCWNLWKHRNAVVFRGQRPGLAGLLSRCREDAGLWRSMLPPNHEHEADMWLASLDQRRGG